MDKLDKASLADFATNYTHFRARMLAGRGSMRGDCLSGGWLKSYATAVAVASLALLAGPEEARGFDLFGIFREAPPTPNPDNLVYSVDFVAGNARF